MNWRAAAIATSLCLLAGSAAHARPPHRKALADYFGEQLAKKLNDCRTCHVPETPDADPEDKPHNAFGARLKAVRLTLRKEGKKTSIPVRLEAVADEDSDGDGVANILEILTGHYPGEVDDVPSAAEVVEGRRVLASFREPSKAYAWTPFEPVKRPSVPITRDTAWVRNPIDAFVAAERETRNLSPRPEAEKPVLLRRVFLDLIGLPPTVEELHAFLSDSAPDAYERAVERLLASSQYGERWGRHWMDVWRYSDWAGWGAQVRDSQPHIWHWRDWIIESLNSDKPYDRMIVEMLAADELSPGDPDALRATGYLVRNFKLLSREKWMQDTVDHTAQAFLGLTLGCARCHDHMYDPILQKEYYQVRSIFEPEQVRTDRIPGVVDVKDDGLPRIYDADLNVKTFLFIRGDDRTPAKDPLEPGVPEALGGSLPKVEPTALPVEAFAPGKRAFEIADDLRASEAAVRKARKALDAAERALEKQIPLLFAFDPLRGLAKFDWAAMGKAVSALEVARVEAFLSEARYEALAAVVEAERLEDSGQSKWDTWSDTAKRAARAQRQAAFLEAQLGVVNAQQARRATPANLRAENDKKVTEAQKALARAEAECEQPVTTAYAKRPVKTYPKASTGRRLAFARWIAAPENPLTARVAVNHIWLRHFGQAIVPSVNDFGKNGRKPSHPALLDWLAAEFVNSGWSMKAIHRLIVTSNTYRQASTPDRSCMAIDPDNVYLWRFAPRRLEAESVRDCVFAVAGTLDPTMSGPDIDHAHGLTKPRRSLYFRHAAEKQMEFLSIFDGPSVTECYRRHETTLPQQALALANSELTLRQSRVLARSLAETCGCDPAGFTTAAFERVLSRTPTRDELVECVAFLHQREEKLGSSKASLSETSSDPQGKKPSAIPALHARENLVHVLMNHHDFLMIR
jgi:hypothetical protein